MVRAFTELGLIMIAVSLLLFPFLVRAETTVIHNSTSATASTGGNSAGSGEVVQGKSSVTASSKTWVNGELVEDEEDTDEDGDGHAEVETEWHDEETGATVTNGASVSTSGETTVYGTPKTVPVETTNEVEMTGTATTSAVIEVSEGSNDYSETSNDEKEPQTLWDRIISYVFSFFSF